MDDGFQWVEALEQPLRAQLWALVGWVSEGAHDRVKAAVPEIVAQSRVNRMPWVEVFARNMWLRSVVLHQEDTRAGLAEAVALTERASHEDTRDCPQTTCVAHALCSAYGLKDGQGNAAVRQAVSIETLAQVDPRRVCWLCISNEHADALIDGGQAEEALTFLHAQATLRRNAGAQVDPDDFGLREAAALLEMGRTEDALARLEQAREPARGESWMRTWRQWKARILAERADPAAVDLLSSLHDLREDGGFRIHIETLDALDRHGLFDEDEGIRHRTVIGVAAVERGVARVGVHALLTAATTLVQQGERALAEATLRHIRLGLPELEQREAEQVHLAQIEQDLDALGPAPEGTIEHSMEHAHTAERVRQLADVWRRFGFGPEGSAFVQGRADALPDDDDLFCAAAGALLDLGDTDALLKRLASPPATEDGAMHALWYRALWLTRSDPDAAIDALSEVVQKRPRWLGVADRLGIVCFSQARYEQALSTWTLAAQAQDRPNAFDWDVIAAATMLGRWDLVRSVGISFGFPLEPGEDPVDQELGVVHLDFDDDPAPFLAHRISPLTARVHSLRHAGQPQKHGQVVLFHPQVLNTEERDESDEWVPPRHRVVCQVSAPDEAFECVAIDGVHPGPEALERFFAAMAELDLYAVRGSDDDYVLQPPTGGDPVPALYVVVAVQPSSAPALHALVHDLSGVFTCPALLRMLDREADAAHHEALQEAWGM